MVQLCAFSLQVPYYPVARDANGPARVRVEVRLRVRVRVRTRVRVEG